MEEGQRNQQIWIQGNWRKFVDYFKVDNGYRAHITNTRKLKAFRELITKEPKVGSILDNTDKGLQQLGIWYPEDVHGNDGNNENQVSFRAKNEEKHDAESVNTQETTLRRGACDADYATLNEGPIATRGCNRDTESLED